MNLEFRCYLVTSGTDRSTVDTAAQAARAGAGMVQVRAKKTSAAQLLQLTVAVAEAVAEANPQTRVVVNDRVDIAMAARQRGAAVHGVHLGQEDLPVTDARTLLGGEAIIGLSAGTLEQVRQADQYRKIIDYLGVGPFRPTPTKDSGREPLGLTGYPRIVTATQLPVIAIGDVTPQDIGELAGTGIAGVALVRSIMQAAQPGRVVHDVLAAWPPERPGSSRQS
ncbi:thiamine phosphate synthase [Enteractinococcus coprophilus]|uniref:Thiamine-phosphate synthase n=1 Tax=Enteractinococcus coprophilus TaxID=1027633 RepID=A0A543ANH2_9MICC|nr:thiamine phosphate synthase [Enteractinococcus coprophilus]TQL74137.1 thiamine-phosphate pyrophosphorylase [Enteractinococcus coprophilus]